MLRLKGLTFQLSFLILTFVGFLSLLLYGYIFIHSGLMLYQEVDNNAEHISKNNALGIINIISNVEKIAYGTRNFVETHNFSLEELNNYQKRIVEKNSEIYGSSICFEPYEADSTQKLYSIFYYKQNNDIKFSDLSSEDYHYPEKDWYKIPKKQNQAMWSEPYYDEGGGDILMTTFSVPFYRISPNGKVLRGIITCDLSLSFLKEYISKNQLIENSYAFVISKQGKFLAHPDTSIIMKKDLFDISNDKKIPELAILGKRMLNGEEGGMETKSIITHKKSLVRYYPIKLNGWSTGVVFPEESIYANLYKLIIEVSILGILAFIILFSLLIWISHRISKPLNIITSATEAIANGNLQKAREISATQWSNYQKIMEKNKNGKIKNEIFRLYIAINQMTNNLYSLIAQVQKSGIQVGSSANEISASSRELEANATEQAASTKEVSSTSKVISQTSSNLSNSIQNINSKTEIALNTARQGKDSLHTLDNALKDLNESTKSITNKLSIISEKANKISSVVTAINKISEQTNLLSFNAAIESEKAGEYGKGFSVVAREISRLAEQTAIATDDIEKMVKEMQSSVSSGVMEMDKFSDEVHRSANHIYSVTEQLSTVIDEVNDYAPSFREFALGMSEQSEAATQISDSMLQLAKASEQSKEALSEFRKATLQLNEAVTGLQIEVSKFSI